MQLQHHFFGLRTKDAPVCRRFANKSLQRSERQINFRADTALTAIFILTTEIIGG
jgi:hypothetical protein